MNRPIDLAVIGGSGLYEFSGNVRCSGLRAGFVPEGPGSRPGFHQDRTRRSLTHTRRGW